MIVTQTTSPGRVPEEERGSAMLELLIAMAVFVVGVVSLAQLFTVAIRSDNFGNSTGQATMLASDKFEELRAQDFSSPTLAPGGSLTDSLDGYSDLDPSGNYTRRWAIFDDTAPPPFTAPSANLRVVVVRVTPKISDALSAKAVQLQTMIGDSK